MKKPEEFAERYIEREMYVPFLTNMSGILYLPDTPGMSELEKVYKKSRKMRAPGRRKIELDSLEKDSISTYTKENIYHALCELTYAMTVDMDTLRNLNNDFVKKRKDAIRHLKTMMEEPFFEKKQVIAEELERLEVFDTQTEPYSEIDFISSWNHVFYDGPYRKLVLKIETRRLTEMLSVPMSFKEERVLQFFSTVLQIVIFRYLHEHEHIPQQEAEHLTVEIIAEYVKGDRELSLRGKIICPRGS